ncbi:MAG: TRIC cation channel family protein [Candidatus Promineofilum sp.]|nr:TRIC cation channel family protein [Promineifilum sp.]
MPPPTQFTVPLYFEYFAILLWATSGAIVGWRKGYDIIGVFVVAFVSSFGGGLLRDGLFLQRLPVVLTDSNYYVLMLIAVVGVVFVGRRINRDRLLSKVVSLIDALGVPMFVIIGAELGRARALELPAVLVVATVSGVGGGLLRDMLVGDTPELLRPGQYNTLLVVIAAALYMTLAYSLGYDRLYTAWGVIIAFFLARLLIIRFNWRSRPVSEFEMRHVLEGVTGWIPGWKKPNSDAMELTDNVADYELPDTK